MTHQPKITIIVAAALGGAIGRAGGIPFRIPADMKHFRAHTLGKPVIMGRKTFESLPGGALPKRRNIVVTGTGFTAPGTESAGTIDEALELCAGAPETMIIGGGTVYSQTLPLASRILLTRVWADYPDADTFFPKIDPEQWRLVAVTPKRTDPGSGLEYQFLTYDRL